ncbi:hypothetical protein Cpir12675_002593 [Ceratocystis pirilliformis]|uniref:Rab-GAP TBC domain-containing protein n=1 Tax=Ceratocystis pirilliformis TaxID=259994 RepID=A0ABR3ZBQ7_9PEZI
MAASNSATTATVYPSIRDRIKNLHSGAGTSLKTETPVPTPIQKPLLKQSPVSARQPNSSNTSPSPPPDSPLPIAHPSHDEVASEALETPVSSVSEKVIPVDSTFQEDQHGQARITPPPADESTQHIHVLAAESKAQVSRTATSGPLVQLQPLQDPGSQSPVPESPLGSPSDHTEDSEYFEKTQPQVDACALNEYSQHAEQSPHEITPPDSPHAALYVETETVAIRDHETVESGLDSPSDSLSPINPLDIGLVQNEIGTTFGGDTAELGPQKPTPSPQMIDFDSQLPGSTGAAKASFEESPMNTEIDPVTESASYQTTKEDEVELDEAVEDIIKRAVQKAAREVESEEEAAIEATEHSTLDLETASSVSAVQQTSPRTNSAEYTPRRSLELATNMAFPRDSDENAPKSLSISGINNESPAHEPLENDGDQTSRRSPVNSIHSDGDNGRHSFGNDSHPSPTFRNQYQTLDKALSIENAQSFHTDPSETNDVTGPADVSETEASSERLIMENLHHESRSRVLTPDPGTGIRLQLELDQAEQASVLDNTSERPLSPSSTVSGVFEDMAPAPYEEHESIFLGSPVLVSEPALEPASTGSSPSTDGDYPLQDIPLSPDSCHKIPERENASGVSSSIIGSLQAVTMREKGRQSLLQVNTTSTSLPRNLDSIAEGRDETESEDAEEVDWDKLQEKEDATPKTPGDDDTTALLLARLEQENAKLAAQPKTIQSPDHQGPPSYQKSPIKQIRKSRPPSMAQLRQMVRSPTPQNLRYSQIEVPQMTDLEFYAAVVQDYQQAAARFPTLLSHKIRKGIPPPLRGVVWQSMASARDPELEGQFDHLCNQDSPYERIIGKDLGRSFPGVDMFRDSNGEGQKKLGRVLKCLSVYDPKIGYCQGLAFVVGPLLMHMPDKQAFCVLVKLMERYDLRSSYQPDLAGLHARIFQFRSLLKTMVPNVASHLESLQVEAAYVSQWFLSVFAVTCPLPMLFRMYDVLFAEGAHETLMRVALSLMKKNEERILACREMEDAMQLLLSRGLWDCYHYNADEFVTDFVALSDAVTREKLHALEEAYLQQAPETFPSAALPSALLSQTPRSNGANGANGSSTATPKIAAVSAAASRFIGRIWAANYSPSNSGTQGPTSDSGAPTLTSPPDSNPTPTSQSQGGLGLGLGSGLGLGILTGTTGTGSTPTSSSSTGIIGDSSPSSGSVSESPSTALLVSDAKPAPGPVPNLSQTQQPASSSSPIASSSESPSSSSTASAPNTLSPGPAPTSRPLSMLHRSASKQSLASTLNSMEAVSNSSILSSASTSSTSTEATTVSISSRDSVSVESTATILPSAIKTTSAIASNAPKSPSILSAAKNQTDERYLHNQIEDLLAALTQLQLNHAILSSELEKERDERDEDKRAVQALLSGLRQKPQLPDDGSTAENDSTPSYTELLHVVEKRFAHSDIGSEAETNETTTKPSLGMSKADLKDELRSAKDQMNAAKSQSQEFQRKIYALDNEVTSLRDQLKDCQTRMRTMHQDKQRMEKQLQTMRQSRSSAQTTNSINVAVGAAETIRNAFNVAAGVPSAEADKPGGSGLRELRLGRGPPSPSQSQFSRRASSVQNRDSVIALSAATAAGATPTSEQDALLLQLVQAKTGEAMAKQEVEELRQKLDSLKKQYGIGDLHTPNRTNTAASAPIGSGSGGFWGGWRR